MKLIQTWVLHENFFDKSILNTSSKEDINLVMEIITNNSNIFEINSRDNIGRGLVKIVLEIKDANDPQYFFVTQVLSEISIDSFVATVPKNSFTVGNSGGFSGDDENNLDMVSIQNKLRTAILEETAITVDYFESNEYENRFELIPFVKGHEGYQRVYISYSQAGKILEAAQLKAVAKSDYNFVNGGKLFNYIMSETVNNFSAENTEDGLLINRMEQPENFNEESFLDVAADSFDNKGYHIVGTADVGKLRTVVDEEGDRKNILVYSFGEYFRSEIQAEIAKMWDFEIEEIFGKGLLIRENEENKDGFLREHSIEKWLTGNVKSIVMGKLPIMNSRGYWQMWEKSSAPLISYAAQRALIDTNYKAVNTFRFYGDMSFSAEFESASHYSHFLREFHKNLERVDSWSVIPCADFIDALIKRYELGDYLDNHCFLVNANGGVYLVSDVDVSSFEFVGKRQELERDLRSFFTRCRAIYAPNGRKVKLENLDLEDILTIVYSNGYGDGYGDEKKINCFSRGSLTHLIERNLPLEPVLQNEIDMARFEYLYYGLSGYFDFGPIRGYHRNPPYNSAHSVPRGRVVASYLEEYIDAVVPVIAVRFVSEEGIRDLFEIAAVDVFEVEYLGERLWEMGFFMSDWGNAYYEKFQELSIRCIKPITFLTMAADTPQRGADALELLRQIVANFTFSFENNSDLNRNLIGY